MADPDLTSRQYQVLAFITEMIDREGYAPTMREIAASCGLASANGAAHVVGRLESLGRLRRRPREMRGLELVAPATEESRSVGSTERTGLVMLHCVYLFEELHLRSVARFVEFAPDPEAMERLYRLLAGRAAQLRAVSEAIGRYERQEWRISARDAGILADVQATTTRSVEAIDSWERYLVHEGVVGAEALVRLQPFTEGPDAMWLSALAGSTAAAKRCEAFASHQIRRLRRTASEPQEFDRRIESHRGIERDALEVQRRALGRLLTTSS